MTRRAGIAASLVVLWTAGAAAAGAPLLEVTQRLGAQLPPAATFIDSHGSVVRLGELSGAAPLLLVPGYFRCSNVCETLLLSTLQSLAMSGLPADAARVVAFSIDPAESAEVAAQREAGLRRAVPHEAGAPSLRLLVGDAATIARVTDSIGFPSRRVGAAYVHPPAVVVIDAGGRISRYLLGPAPTPAELRDAISAAAAGAAPSFADRITLLCSALDPTRGALGDSVLVAARIVAATTLAGLVAVVLLARLRR